MRYGICFRRAITESDEAVDLLKKTITASERLARKLRHCLRDDNTAPETVANDAINGFYARCEKRFWKLCDECVNVETIQTQYRAWCEEIGHFAQDAYSDAMSYVNLRGKALAKAAEQQKWLFVETKKIMEDAEA